jgi:dTDP-4-dehydrorhamnose reductase
MKNILITGSNGQLGSSLHARSNLFPSFRFTFIDLPDLDLTREDAVRNFLRDAAPDYIIHCAAYTAVDLAEKNKETAFQVNADIPCLLGNYCRLTATRLIHISTDYVYNGKLSLPHLEDEPVMPVSVYGKSKMEGEKCLWDNPNALVIRTSWLYSEYGNNFLKSILRLGLERKELGVVFDQAGTPTYAGDLASAILKIIHHSENNTFIPGVFNYSDEGVCSWYDFAVEILKLTNSNCIVRPIRTAEYPLPAVRPEYSVMDKSKIKKIYGIKIPYWRDSLIIALQNLEKNKEI